MTDATATAPATKPFTAVIVGGTGATGRHVVKELLQSESCTLVKALVRKPKGPEFYGVTEAVAVAKLQEVAADFEKLADVDKSVWQADIGICTMGTTKAIAGSAAAFRRVDYDYVTQSAQLMKDNGVKCYLQCSSQGASATSWLLYPKTKGQAEEACKIMKFAHCAIFRPAVLITPREQKRPMEGFFQAICPDAFSIKSTHLAACMVQYAKMNFQKEGGEPVTLENGVIKNIIKAVD